MLFVVAVAVLGLALIAMGEDIGGEMAFRSMGHLVSIQTQCLGYCCREGSNICS
jgi:hypothetical protein